MSNLKVSVPEIITSGKGFIIIPINLQQNLHVGGQCICDSCNKASFDTMYFIPVLANRTYCAACFNRWHRQAEYYPEDSTYEKRAAEIFIQKFS